jgi:methanogenic corrinoid protein MtbC1
VATIPTKDEYLAALLAGDGTRARHLVTQALDDGAAPVDLYLDVLAPALVTVGELWECGELGVAYEHYATSVTQGIMGAVAPRMRRPPRGGRLAVLVCVPGEQHALGVQMAGDVLESAAWEVLQLGPGLPAPSLVALVADEQPDVVGLSVATPSLLPGAREMVGGLHELDPRPFVVLGGRACSELPSAELATLGADAAVADARELVQLVTERFPPLPEDDADDADAA